MPSRLFARYENALHCCRSDLLPHFAVVENEQLKTKNNFK
jgi:hypothetical protein